MENFKVYFEKAWDFLVNPPVEVVQATTKFLSETANCVSTHGATFINSLVESFKGIF